MKFLNEPTAAALSYALERKAQGTNEKQTCLVFDIGGGTLDISVLTIEGNSIKTLSTNGDIHLGGADFDREILDICMEEIKVRYSDKDINWDSNNGKKKMLRLLKASTEAKMNLYE